MSTVLNVFLAVLFVALAFSATFLMYHLWGYPFSKKEHRSTAPRWAMNLHRLMGWAFVAIYVYLMIQMIPRMWTYQIELPARTVFHLVLGYSIGGILIAKIAIVRFFKHLESTLAPPLGTTLFLLTIVLMGLALPSVWKERALAEQAMGSEGFSEERLQRVRDHLPDLGYDTGQIDEIATRHSLLTGRNLLRHKCVLCHDLRTILARPRTPANWHDTVERMARRAEVVTSFTEQEKWQITSYLIAITPTLQQSVMQQRKQQTAMVESAAAAKIMSDNMENDNTDFDEVAAKAVFESKCSQCHSSDRGLQKNFANAEEVHQLVSRMVSNGLTANTAELEQIVRFLQKHHNLSASNDTAQPATTEETVATTPSEMPLLASESGCTGCHAIDSKLVGPSWSDVANRYRNDPQARQQLVERIKNGGSGNWVDQTGGIPMPANFPRVSQQQTEELVDFILALP